MQQSNTSTTPCIKGKTKGKEPAGPSAGLLLSLLLLCALLFPRTGKAGEHLRIFYSNDVRAELEACG